jgi:hypothetical protein
MKLPKEEQYLLYFLTPNANTTANTKINIQYAFGTTFLQGKLSVAYLRQ